MDTMEFKIETGITKPKPVRSHGTRVSKYPFASLQIGQSFKVAYNVADEKSVKTVERSLRAAIGSFRKKAENKHVVLSTRTVTGNEEKEGGIPGLRVWRDPAKATVATA